MTSHWLRSALAAAAPALLGACHAGARTGAPEPARRNGAYDYVAHVSGAFFAGTFRVVEDTILVEARDGACWYDKASISPFFMRFRCDGVSEVQDFTIRLDRRNPVRASSWSGYVYRSVQRQVCDRYVTDSNGRRTCAAWRTETEEVKQFVGGSLSVQSSRLGAVP